MRWWVPVYCLHHDEEELIGSDPVPCPFCGFGAEEASTATEDDTLQMFGLEDSTEALRHAMATDEDARPSKNLTNPGDLRGYW